MTSLLTAYTPLESLLLFQALRSQGVHSISFTRVSDQLNNIPLIRADPTYDRGRLSPDALRELYLGLLKDEVKRDLERQVPTSDNHAVNGDRSPGSRKRKVASPSLPTVHEAAQHSHLIPQLISRLYTRYRENFVRALREKECRYGVLTREIEEIEAGNWDERLQHQRTPSVTNSPKPSTVPIQAVKSRSEQPSSTDSSAVASPIASQSTQDRSSLARTKPYSQTKIDAVINHDPPPPNGPGSPSKASPATTLPSMSDMAPQSPHSGIPPNLPTSRSTSIVPMPHPGGTVSFGQSPQAGQQSAYSTHHAHPIPASVNSPQLQQAQSRSSSSPRPVLPPPQGMGVPSVQYAVSPGLHGHGVPIQQSFPGVQRIQAAPSPTRDQQYHAYNGQQMPPHLAGYYQQPPYADRRPSYPSQQQPHTPTYPGQTPLAGGYALPPFQIAPQDHPHLLQHRLPLSPNQTQRLSQYASQSHSVPGSALRNSLPTNPRLMSEVVKALATPPRKRIQPLWKSDRRPSSFEVPSEVPRPAVEPMSPTRERPKSPARSTRLTRNRETRPNEYTPQLEVPSTTRSGRRRRNLRNPSPHSAVSSTADESFHSRTRSQSLSATTAVSHHPDERPGSSHGVKAEPSTPANVLEDAESTSGPSATTASGPMTRKRRGTLQTQPLQSFKRRRQDSPSVAGEEHDTFMTPPPKTSTVLATRNFAKVSAPIMNDINSHKHASYFTNPVRDRDAPGYNEIVLQPQNLKSIRAAITAGSRAINAAAASQDSPTGTPAATTTKAADGSTILELERTADLVPPKAIVNGVQLEKEIMKMFANAFMFNPGEDGMAAITTEMCRDVEQKIGEWRGAEREAGGDDEEDAKSKRRKL